MRKAVHRLSVPSRLSSPGMGCALAAAAGGLSFVALEADATVDYNPGLHVMFDKSVNIAVPVNATNVPLVIRAASNANTLVFPFVRNASSQRVIKGTSAALILVNPSISTFARKFDRYTNITTSMPARGGSRILHYPGGGAFKGVTGYIGIKIKLNVKGSGVVAPHLGWVKYSGSGVNASGTIHSYAYKVATNTTIRAAGPRVEGLSRAGGGLSWKAVSEEGVARYEVEARGSDGSWSPVATVLPGKADYQVEGLGAGACRLVSVDVDGVREAVPE